MPTTLYFFIIHFVKGCKTVNGEPCIFPFNNNVMTCANPAWRTNALQPYCATSFKPNSTVTETAGACNAATCGLGKL